MNGNVNVPSDALPEGISAALDKLLSNPQLMNMVASALGSASSQNKDPASDNDGNSENDSVSASVSAPPTPTLPSIDTLMPIIGKLSSTADTRSDFKHEALLCAIKPYLNPRRCQAIDGIIRISKMSAIVRQLK